MSSYFVSIRDESRYQSANSSGIIKYGLKEDSDFDLRQATRSAQFANKMVNMEGYRQQFDSISKDFLSREQQNFDTEIGSFHQGLSTSLLSTEQKW